MISIERAAQASSPALTRLASLAPLDDVALAAFGHAMRNSHSIPARRELLAEGEEITAAKILMSGWAARVRLLPDGRRQILSLILPGDVIGNCRHARPLAISSVVAITDATLCVAPPADTSPNLAEAYAVSYALEEAYLLAQVAGLGRMNAQERIADLFLELHERLNRAGMVGDGSFTFPLTQEALADVLGLTSVHINRVVQTLRRDGGLLWKSGEVSLFNVEALAANLGRSVTRVSAKLPDQTLPA